MISAIPIPTHGADASRMYVMCPTHGHRILTSGPARNNGIVNFINNETTGLFYIGYNFVVFDDANDAAFFKLKFGR